MTTTFDDGIQVVRPPITGIFTMITRTHLGASRIRQPPEFITNVAATRPQKDVTKGGAPRPLFHGADLMRAGSGIEGAQASQAEGGGGGAAPGLMTARRVDGGLPATSGGPMKMRTMLRARMVRVLASTLGEVLKGTMTQLGPELTAATMIPELSKISRMPASTKTREREVPTGPLLRSGMTMGGPL